MFPLGGVGVHNVPSTRQTVFISSGPVEDGELLGTVFIVSVILWVKMCGDRSEGQTNSPSILSSSHYPLTVLATSHSPRPGLGELGVNNNMSRMRNG